VVYYQEHLETITLSLSSKGERLFFEGGGLCLLNFGKKLVTIVDRIFLWAAMMYGDLFDWCPVVVLSCKERMYPTNHCFSLSFSCL
jgi:hypothetical protein